MTFIPKVIFQGVAKKAAPCLMHVFLLLAISFSSFAFANTSTKSQAVQNTELLMRLEQLRLEVQELRNQVEIQANQLKQNETSQRSRYLDLDQRAQEQAERLTKLEDLQTSFPSLTATTPAEPSLNLATPSKKQSSASSVEDKRAYDAAYNLVVSKDFNQAIKAFQNFINDYPSSNLVGNAYYWLGEIYLTQSATQEAKKMFLAVTNNYPNSFKLADSKYKLGTIEFRYGNQEQAKKLMQQLIEEHPKEPAAELAKAYLNRNS